MLVKMLSNWLPMTTVSRNFACRSIVVASTCIVAHLALDLRSAIAAVAMSQASSSHAHDVPTKVITVIKMDGSEFKIRVLNLSRFKVTDLKRSIAMQEHIAEDMFDLSTGDMVLNSRELMNLSLADAGILDTVFLTMKETVLNFPEAKRCTLCKVPHRFWQVLLLCRDFHMQQARLLQQVRLPRSSDTQPADDDDDDDDDYEYA